VGLVVGIVSGLAVGGWLSGNRSAHSHRFHGSVTGLLLAFVVVVVARFGGSPREYRDCSVAGLVSIVIGGLAGWLGGRRRTPSR
jgi:hypothetical protein